MGSTEHLARAIIGVKGLGQVLAKSSYRPSVLYVVCASVALVALAGCGSSGIPSNAVVNVNGQPITKAAYDYWLAAAAAANGKRSKPVSNKKLQSETLGLLILAQQTMHEAKALGVSVTPKQVERQFDLYKKQTYSTEALYRQFLKESGQTPATFLLAFKNALLIRKIQNKIADTRAHVTEAQVDKFYRENSSYYEQAERRSVEMIQTKTRAEAEAAKQEIQAGKNFASVASERSAEPMSTFKEQVSHGVTKEDEEKELGASIFSARSHVLVGPIKVNRGFVPTSHGNRTVFGYFVFEVKRILNPTLGLAGMRATVRQQLLGEDQQAVVAKYVRESNKRWKAKTDCRSGYVVLDCRQYKAPSPAVASATGS